MRVCLVALAAAATAGVAQASPNVEPDDPRYDELARREALGELPLYYGGFGPLSEARVRHLLGQPRVPGGGWLRVDRALVRVTYDHDSERRYSTPARHRDLTGSLAVTCEHSLGRPCRRPGTLGEVDGSAGLGDDVSATVRLRGDIDSEGFGSALAIDRLFLRGSVGPATLEVGRDILLVGPRSRTQLAWGDNAPPLDQVRIATARPYPLTQALRGNLLYVVGRLRQPQRFAGNLVTISRVQLDVVDRVEVAVQQMIMLGGEGARELGPIDFVLEHVRRTDLSASETDSSNRRFGGDVTWHLPELGARFYYQVVFEDIRKARWIDAVRYDADHLFGLELAALGQRHGLTVEYHQTGVRSQEHSPRTTGFTNANRVVGSPLGPDAKSFYVAGRIELPRVIVYPWLEYARLASDTYAFELDGPITLTTRGPHEFRYRVGTRFRVPIPGHLFVEGETILERVTQFRFVPGDDRTDARIGASVVYRAP